MKQVFHYLPDGYSVALVIELESGKLLATNYFEHELCRDGLYKGLYLDGVYHLLIPTFTMNHGVIDGTGEGCLKEMRTGRLVIADVGPGRNGEQPVVNLVFDDGTDTPFSTTVPRSQSEPFFSEADDARHGLLFKAYLGPGVEPSLVLEMKLRFVDNPYGAWQWNPAIDEIPNRALRMAARQARDRRGGISVFTI